MEQFTVTGMSCAACQARVEKAVAKVPGVDSCSVSLLTNSMGVEGSADASAIIAAVENAGYGASLKEAAQKSSGSLTAKLAAEEEALADHTTPALKKRLIASLGFLIVLMYFSMGHMMWGWPLPAWFNDNHIAMGLIQLLLAGIVMIINQKFFVSGFKSLFHLAPNMDTLIALGSSASFVYSTVMLFAMTRAQVDGNGEAVMKYMHEFYFEGAAMILAFITLGKMLESYSKGKTTNALKALMKLAPKTANVLRDGQEVTISVDDVVIGDLFTVRPGENVPVDGVVVEGTSAINEAALTGESLPVDKAEGDTVSSGTMNQSGFLTCRATKVGEDTSLAQIIQMVSDAAATKAPVAKLADTISGVFVPVVILIAFLTTVIWMLVGQPFGFALARGISVLVVSCPCALGLATPVAIMVGNGMGAKHGIMFKTAESLQETGNTQIIAFDKTGTITSGQPKVTDLLPAQGFTKEQLVTMVASLEQKSEHPLAKAVMDYAGENGVVVEEVSEFTALPGNGLSAVLNGQKLVGGSQKFITEMLGLNKANVPASGNAVSGNTASMLAQADELATAGKTPLLFSVDGKFLGIIAVADTIKEDSAKAIAELRGMGIHTVMLTGDNERTAAAIGAQAGVDEVIAGVLPDGKEAVIRALQEHGKVAMVGDGINDAPALTRADIGIAIGAGTDVAIDAADVVLMKSKLEDVPAAIRLSRQTFKHIVENLFWALIYNVLLVPVAAGAYSHLFGLTMNPMLGAAAMSMSSFFVVSNALRLNLFKMYDSKHDKKLKNAIQVGPTGKLIAGSKKVDEDVTNNANADAKSGNGSAPAAGTFAENHGGKEDMTKTIKIEGMMCGHCEATVKKALEALEQVDSAVVSHEAGTAVITLNGDVDDAVLKETVEAKDYTVTGIEA